MGYIQLGRLALPRSKGEMNQHSKAKLTNACTTTCTRSEDIDGDRRLESLANAVLDLSDVERAGLDAMLAKKRATR